MEETNRVKLLKKILELKKSITYFQKGAKGPQFDYVSSDQVLAAANAKMNEIGLILVTAVTGRELTQFQTKNGSPQFMTEMDMIISWVDVETGEELAIPFYGQGVDNGEKGVGKSLTYAEKYFLLKQLNVPTSKDDPDSFQEKHESSESKEDKKAQLITELKTTDDLARVTAIWKTNQHLKADKAFKDAVGEAGKRLKPAVEPTPEA